MTSYNFDISYSLACSKTWGKGPKRLKILKIDHFSYVRALLHAKQDHQVKENTSGNANITLIIPCNSNISRSLTCPKIWAKGHKEQKVLRINHFS